MIRYLLDTNICIELIRRRNRQVVDQLRRCAVGDVGLSVITQAELTHGVHKSSNPARNAVALAQFLAPFEIQPFDSGAARIYGRIRATLEAAGTLIGPMDLLIAAHALASKAILITNNEREFLRVENLVVENWTKA